MSSEPSISSGGSSNSSLKYVSKLSGKRVLVLGGTSGIGYCVAEAALEHGATVIVSSSSASKIAQTTYRLKGAYPDSASRVSGHRCDLSQPASLEGNLETLFKASTTEGTKIDHVVFTAGDALTLKTVAEATIEDIQAAGVVRFMAPLVLGKVAPK